MSEFTQNSAASQNPSANTPEASVQIPQTKQQIIAWVRNHLNKPPFPISPQQSLLNNKVEKQPAYYDRHYYKTLEWKPYQKWHELDPKLQEQLITTWHSDHRIDGVSTLGGWNGQHWLCWIDFDLNASETPEILKTRIDAWINTYPILQSAPQFFTPSGGYRVLVAFLTEPEKFGANNGFAFTPNTTVREGELLTKNGGHTLLPPTVGSNGKKYEFTVWSEYPPTVPGPESIGLYPCKDTKTFQRQPLERKTNTLGNAPASQIVHNGFGQSLVDILEQEIYPKLSADSLFGDLENWKGTEKNCWCPFCTIREKAPSFNVPADKTTFFCYGCRATGSWADYIMLRDGVDFKTAIKTLANIARVQLPPTFDKVSDPIRQSYNRNGNGNNSHTENAIHGSGNGGNGNGDRKNGIGSSNSNGDRHNSYAESSIHSSSNSNGNGNGDRDNDYTVNSSNGIGDRNSSHAGNSGNSNDNSNGNSSSNGNGNGDRHNSYTANSIPGNGDRDSDYTRNSSNGNSNSSSNGNGKGNGDRDNGYTGNSDNSNNNSNGNGNGDRNNGYGYPGNSGNGSGDNSNGYGGDNNNNQPPPEPEFDLYTQIHNIVTSNLEPGRQLAALVELGAATGHPQGGIEKIAREIELSLNRQNTAPDDATELSKLLTYRAEHLDIPSIYPKALASALLSKADSDRIDPIYLIMYLLSACGAKLGGNIGIVAKSGATTEDDWVEFPIFWTMNVAPPSSGKSQTQRTIFKPIKRQQKLARTQYKQAKQHLKQLENAWKQKTPSEKEALLNSPQNPAVYESQMPAPPAKEMIEAGSPEGAFKRMSELAPHSGCALVFDELVRVLKMDQYKDGGGDTRQILLEAWGAPLDKEFERVDSENTVILEDIAISLTGAIQTQKFKTLCSDPDDGDGLASRFLMAIPKTPDNFAIWSNTVVGLDSMLTGVYDHLKNLPNALKDIRRSISRSNEATLTQSWETSNPPVMLHFDCHAEERWHRWWESIRRYQQAYEVENPALSAYLGKMLSQTLRLALLLHCLELKFEPKADPQRVGIDTLERAIAQAKFHIGQFRVLMSSTHEGGSLAGRLLQIHEYALRKQGEVSPVQVQNTVFRHAARKPTLSQIRLDFKTLADMGHAELCGEGKSLQLKAVAVKKSDVGIPTKFRSNSDKSRLAETTTNHSSQRYGCKNSDNSDNFEIANKNELAGSFELASSFEINNLQHSAESAQELDVSQNMSLISDAGETSQVDMAEVNVADFSNSHESLNVTPSFPSTPGGNMADVADFSNSQETTTSLNCRNNRNEERVEASKLELEGNSASSEVSEFQSEAIGNSDSSNKGVNHNHQGELAKPPFVSSAEPNMVPYPPTLEELKALIVACQSLTELKTLNKQHGITNVGKAYQALNLLQQAHIDSIAANAVPHKVYKYLGQPIKVGQQRLKSGALVYIDPQTAARMRPSAMNASVWDLNGVPRGWTEPVEVPLSDLKEVVKFNSEVVPSVLPFREQQVVVHNSRKKLVQAILGWFAEVRDVAQKITEIVHLSELRLSN
ncbi:DUF3987 domain-containing protein [Kamptonema animale CS-326]|jgi:hypothetical protein|uniref:DUF3987 domain-containing protein n=1 Tax=Kamptonema animale TaxID=92934 RepID=UPI00232C959F|nr:DUF3987 domain-containing protein [Kamptonema animale]MDB9514988.1 DUF3987 domain-containing protein [Kamptonema animale CS-326]